MNLSNKSGPELVNFFNAIPGVTPVKRFASRAAAVKRITRELADSPNAMPATLEGPAELVVNGEVVGTIGRPENDFVYDYPKRNIIRSHRVNSGRGRLIIMMRAKLTFDQLLEGCPQWTASQLNKTIRMLHTWLGYGVQTQQDGTIHLIEA